MCGAAEAKSFTAPATVVDGDTVKLGPRDLVFRLHGIDAPELDQYCAGTACGQQAHDWLVNLIEGEPVQCRTIGNKDRYGRYVAKCYHAGQDIGALMVEAGYARAYLKYSNDYALLEKEASLAERGFWATDFSLPSAHRAAQTRVPDVPDRCVVKGNISPNSGEKIYHIAGQQHYDKVGINLSKGEACFDTEAEARAAGWRKARR